MEHLSLSTVTIGSKDIDIGSVLLGDKVIAEANQARSSTDRKGHGYQYFLFGSWKSGNEISVDFGRNANENISMNPSRATRSPCSQITRTRLSNCNIFDSVSRGLTWHGTIKSECENKVENLRGDNIFKNSERENNSEVEKLGTKFCKLESHRLSIINWNKKYYDLINVDPNHTNSNQLNPSDLTNIGSIHDSTNICAIENIFPLPVHSPVHTSPIFIYGGASDPTSPLHDSLE